MLNSPSHGIVYSRNACRKSGAKLSFFILTPKLLQKKRIKTYCFLANEFIFA